MIWIEERWDGSYKLSGPDEDLEDQYRINNQMLAIIFGYADPVEL